MFQRASHGARTCYWARYCGQLIPAKFTDCGWSWRSLLTTAEQSKVLLIYPKNQSTQQQEEAVKLTESYCGEVSHCQAVGPKKGATVHPATFFGSGAVQEVRQLCDANSYQQIVVNTELSGNQQKNLEQAWGRPVLDRIGLIIEIFALRARTREARLQVEMAALQHKSSRLVRTVDSKSGARKGFGIGGDTEVVSARERGRSGSGSGGLGGGSGGGETELQLQRRRILSRIKALKRKLGEVRRTRTVQRQGRSRSGQPVVAVVGYTSAGKSSLVSALSHTHLESRERLFETLDPVMRRVVLPSGSDVLVSDTVGFISDLPHALISSFQATLEEVVEADALLHVLDASSPNVLAQRQAVYKVLRQLDIPENRLQNNVIEVWNKSDLIDSNLESCKSIEDADSFRTLEQGRSEIEKGLPGNCQKSSHNTGEISQGEAILETERESSSSPGPHTSDDCRAGHHRNSENLEHHGDEPMHGVSSLNERLEHEKALEADSCKCSERGSNEGSPAEPERAQQDAVWKLLKEVQRLGNDLHPKAVVTSTVTGQGLADLLWELGRMVSVRQAIQELRFKCSRSGPRALKENVVGPAIKNEQMRKALPKRLPLMQPIREETVRRIAIWQH